MTHRGLHPGLRWSQVCVYVIFLVLSSACRIIANKYWPGPSHILNHGWIARKPRKQICWGGVEKDSRKKLGKLYPSFYLWGWLLCQALFQALENQQFFHPWVELTSWHYFCIFVSFIFSKNLFCKLILFLFWITWKGIIVILVLAPWKLWKWKC